jgi:hypothetical protein
MKNWLKELCPEIADWQVELLAEAASNAVKAEREECAQMFDGSSRIERAVAAAIRARGAKHE